MTLWSKIISILIYISISIFESQFSRHFSHLDGEGLSEASVCVFEGERGGWGEREGDGGERERERISLTGNVFCPCCNNCPCYNQIMIAGS